MRKCHRTLAALALLPLLFTLMTASAHAGGRFRPTPDPALPLLGYRVAIDPGHQRTSDARQEPIGPGMKGTKPRNKSGTQGVVTKRRESEVNLEIALKLRDRLRTLGATVLMIRETENVKISNIERATMANEFRADVYLRLHCNGSDNRSVSGASVYVPRSSPYMCAMPDLYMDWGKTLLGGMCKASGAKNAGVHASDHYSGSNWAKPPVFLVEMGYMTNPAEDKLLSTPSYQKKLVEGMCNFVKTMPRRDYRIDIGKHKWLLPESTAQ